MADASQPELSMLEAIQLFNNKPAEEWSAGELEAFRLRLKQSPSLESVLGGQKAIQRRLALVTAAMEKSTLDAAAPLPAAEAAARPRAPRNYRRFAEAACFAILLSGASYWLLTLLRTEAKPPESAEPSAAANKSDGPIAAAKPTAAANPTAAPKNIAATNRSAAPQPETSTKPSAVDDGSPPLPDGAQAAAGPVAAWQGWTVSQDVSAKTSVKKDWDLSDPGRPKPTQTLLISGGPVKLSQRFTPAAGQAWLELNAQPGGSAAQPGRIVVRINDQAVSEHPIGKGDARWPVYIPLEGLAGKECALEVVFEPGVPQQRIVWWSAAPVSERLHEAKAESALTADLASSDWKVRLAAAKLAGQMQDQYALPALIRALDDNMADVRSAAAASLARYDSPEAREAMRTVLASHPELAVRSKVAGHLVNRAESGDVAVLAKALQSPDARVRFKGVRALSRVKGDEAVEPLIGALGDPDPLVRLAAATSLSARDTRAKKITSDKGAEAIDRALIGALGGSDDAVRVQAARHFQFSPNPAALEALLRAVEKGNDQVRLHAARALGASPDSDATQGLERALSDSNSEVRQTAATALINRKGVGVDAALIKSLLTDRDNVVRRMAAVRFQIYPNPAATMALAGALKDGDDPLRKQIVLTLSRSGDPAALAGLRTALADPNADVRQAAAAALKKINSAEALLILQENAAGK